MDVETRGILKEVLPNFPESLAEEWLAPYVKDLGKPRSDGRWLDILSGRPLDFWRTVVWKLVEIDLAECRLTPEREMALAQMYNSYFQGIWTPFSVIADGRERTLQVLSYLQVHRVFPKPPAFYCGPDGLLETVDGNHRMLALRMALSMTPPAAEPIQEAWIGRQLA